MAAQFGVCRLCGCTDERACPGGCSWVDETHTLCSSCAAIKAAVLFGNAKKRAEVASKLGPDLSKAEPIQHPCAVCGQPCPREQETCSAICALGTLFSIAISRRFHSQDRSSSILEVLKGAIPDAEKVIAQNRHILDLKERIKRSNPKNIPPAGWQKLRGKAGKKARKQVKAQKKALAAPQKKRRSRGA